MKRLNLGIGLYITKYNIGTFTCHVPIPTNFNLFGKVYYKKNNIMKGIDYDIAIRHLNKLNKFYIAQTI